MQWWERLFFYNDCLVCNREVEDDGIICRLCLKEVCISPTNICGKCGKPGVDGMCDYCRGQEWSFERAVEVVEYRGAARELILRFKYAKWHSLTKYLVDWLEEGFNVYYKGERLDGVVSVPMYFIRRWWRGYDHSRLLAQAFSRRVNINYLPRAVRCRRWTRRQVNLSWEQRVANPRGAFYAHREQVWDRRLLLVDDVLTTGATANAVAWALKEAGASAVFVLAVARGGLTKERENIAFSL